MTDPWFTLARWAILLGLIGAIVGTPVVYFNHRIDEAHKLGIEEGRAACVADYAAQALKQKQTADDQLRQEAKRAQEFQEKADKSEANAAKLQEKLKDALKKDPPVSASGCIFTPNVTSILREFARNGGSTSDAGEPLSSPFNTEVPGHPAVPGQGNPRHGG